MQVCNGHKDMNCMVQKDLFLLCPNLIKGGNYAWTPLS